MRKFIRGFVEIVRPLNDFLKKGAKKEWIPEIKKSFEDIKVAISTILVLVSLDYDLPFKIYSFSLENSCAGILTHKKDKEDERPISFMSCPLNNVELSYSNIKKLSFDLIKVVKKFCHYILRSKVYAIVPNLEVKSLLMQKKLGERWGKWMVILKEFDLEIQKMKLVRGQGLKKITIDNEIGNENEFRFDDETNTKDQDKKIIVSQVDIDQGIIMDVWYQDIVYNLLQNQYPNWMNSSLRRGLKMKYESYMLKNRKLYKRNYEGIYLKCLGWEEVKEVLE